MKPDSIVLHHSLTPDYHTVSWRAIRGYHTQKLGWQDIGYHFGIERVGRVYEVFAGRPLNMVGAHCKQQGMNHRSIGICFVGNFDDSEVPDRQWLTGLKLVKGLIDVLEIPKESIHGHNEFATYKTCPGSFFDVEQFIQEL
jgi:N-acetyl-anhydromuramyl-L-alanine amidase AmpD